jgi:hypothetical protein
VVSREVATLRVMLEGMEVPCLGGPPPPPPRAADLRSVLSAA